MRLQVGKKYKIRCTVKGYCTGQTAPYPYWDEQYVPVKVIGENRTFYTVRTLPHTKPYGAWGEAKPYTVSIDKLDLDTNVMIANPIP